MCIRDSLTGETFGSALTFGAASKASAPGQVGVHAVSYTHLDVYKRQGKSCILKGKSLKLRDIVFFCL